MSDKTNQRDFIISTVPNQSVSMNPTIKAHDKQHNAVVASIVAQPGPSFSAGPSSAHARESVKSLREKNFEENEAVLAAAAREEAVADAATTPEMAAAARAGEEAYCVADRDRTQQEHKLNLRSLAAEKQKAHDEVERARQYLAEEEKAARARHLAQEEEAARVRRIADDDTIRARRRDEEEAARGQRIIEEAARAAEARLRLAAEVIAVEESVRTKHAEEAEAARGRRIAEIADAERCRAARIADEERIIAQLKLRIEEQAAQDRQQQDRQQPPEMQMEVEPEEELEAAHRTGVLHNAQRGPYSPWFS